MTRPTAGPSEFDALARRLAAAFGTEYAQVVTVNSTGLALLGHAGAAVPAPLDHTAIYRETPAWSSPEWIADLALHPRLASAARVSGAPTLRFFACAPLASAEGAVIGWLAVFDPLPRRPASPADMASLHDWAGVATALIERRHLLDELHRLTSVDPLTRLPAQTGFERAVSVELQHAMRTGEPFAVIHLSVDGLQTVRDGFGPQAAIEVLHHIAQRLGPQVRLGDVLARLAGDDFAVLMRHGGEDSASVLLERMVRAVGQPFALSSGDTVGVGISAGLAAYTDQTQSVAQMMQEAESALAAARAANERKFGFFASLRP